MSLPDQEKLPPGLVGTVASRYLSEVVNARLAAFNMDMFDRLSVLEGAAGVTAGSWLRKGERGFGAAVEHFGPHLAASWTTTRSQGVYDKALAVASRMLSSASGLEPADLIQDMTINSSRSSGPDRTKLFYTVGKKLASHKNDLGAGSITPRDSKIMGAIDRWVRMAALDEIKSWRARNVRPFSLQDNEGGRGTQKLNRETKDHLILLALQSPGGPGNEVRRTIDHLIDQSFPKRDRGMVRLFLQKVSEPKYRSADQMRQIVKRFTPEKWFTQAFRTIRDEIMRELGVTSQQLTNALGSNAKKVFKFMSEKVGKDAKIKRIIDDLAEEIEILEPGVSRIGKERRYELTEEQTPQQPHKKMLEWLEGEDEGDDEKKASRPEKDFLHDIFEKDEYMDWDAGTGPHAVHNRGPVILRVAQRFLVAKGTKDPEFMQWAEAKPFPSPKTREPIKFTSLPAEEQARIYEQWRARKQQQEGQQKQQPSQEKSKWQGLPQEEANAFKKWVKEQGPETEKQWSQPGNAPARKEIWQKFKTERKRQPTTLEQMTKEKKNKGPGVSKPKELSPEDTKKFLSTPPDERTESQIKDTNGNTFRQNVTVEGNPNINKSRIGGRARVGGNSQVTSSTLSENAVVEDNAQVSRSDISGYARLRGDTKVNNAKIRGGSWDGQDLKDGHGGVFHDAYDQDVLDALTSIKGSPGPGDGPLRAMARYFADGGRTKGWFGVGGDLDRKKLTQRIQDHVYDDYDRKNPWLGRGASNISGLDDKGFETVMGAAKELGTQWRAEKQKKGSDRHMLYELTKMAFARPELRSELMPFVKMGHKARIASEAVDLRGITIRAAFNSRNPDLRRTLLEAVVASDKSGVSKTAKTRKRRYRQPFLRWIANKKFRNPNPDARKPEVVFDSLPSEEQTRIYQEWQASYRDWAQKHMPAGLGSDTRVNPENFDKIEVGDMLWYNASPGKPLKVVNINRDGWRANNPVLELVQADFDNSDFQGKERHFTKSSLNNEFLELHQFPDQGPAGERRKQQDESERRRKNREKVQKDLPREPKGGWPLFDHVGLGTPAQRSVQQAFKGMADVADPKEMSLGKVKDRLEDRLGDKPDRKVLREFMHQLGDWAAELGQAAKDAGDDMAPEQKKYKALRLKVDQGIRELDGEHRDGEAAQRKDRESMKPDWERVGPKARDRWDEEQQGKMKPIYAEAMKEIADGRFVDKDYAEKLIEKLNKAGGAVAGVGRPVAVGVLIQFMNHAAENAADPDKKKKLEEGVQNAAREAARLNREHRNQNQERAQHKDRQEIRGGGQRNINDDAKLGSWFISQILPKGVSDEIRAKGREQLKKAKYGDLQKMRQAAQHILKNEDSDFAKGHALVKHLGYDREGLKKLEKLIRRKMGDVLGRPYHADVLEIANKYGLETEDADALYDWRADKPGRGARISDQEKMSRFLAKAKPETKERMRDMSLRDFMVMYKAILKEVLEDEEVASQAA